MATSNFWATGKYIPKHRKTEESLQIRVATYLKRNYSSVVFSSDAAGMFMSLPMAVRWKRQNSDHKRPDLFIYARSADDKYSLLALELKPAGTTIYVTRGAHKGAMTADPHIRAQAACHELLRAQGIRAEFAVGYDQAVRLIDEHMGTTNTELF